MQSIAYKLRIVKKCVHNFFRERISLSKKYVAFMQIDEKVFHDLISKRRTAIHISSVLNARRFAPHVYLPRIVVPNIKNKRNSHFIGLRK